MGITLSYQPSFDSMGQVSFQAGQGKFEQAQDQFQFQQDRFNQDLAEKQRQFDANLSLRSQIESLRDRQFSAQLYQRQGLAQQELQNRQSALQYRAYEDEQRQRNSQSAQRDQLGLQYSNLEERRLARSDLNEYRDRNLDQQSASYQKDLQRQSLQNEGRYFQTQSKALNDAFVKGLIDKDGLNEGISKLMDNVGGRQGPYPYDVAYEEDQIPGAEQLQKGLSDRLTPKVYEGTEGVFEQFYQEDENGELVPLFDNPKDMNAKIERVQNTFNKNQSEIRKNRASEAKESEKQAQELREITRENKVDSAKAWQKYVNDVMSADSSKEINPVSYSFPTVTSVEDFKNIPEGTRFLLFTFTSGGAVKTQLRVMTSEGHVPAELPRRTSGAERVKSFSSVP